jgi:protein tyrosine/serine phosphatase
MTILTWSGCRNVRDVGGLLTTDGRTVQDRRLVRSDCLDRLDDDGRAALASYGVSRVIDLRSDFELDRTPHPLAEDASYVRIPWIDPQRDVERERDGEGDLAGRYRGSLDRNTRQVAAVVRAFVEAPPGPVLVHCHAGKDRTGMLVALLLELVGVDRDVIAEDYAQSEGFLGIPDRIAALETDLERQEAETFWRTLPETIASTLKHLDAEYGSAEDYLRDACGLNADEIQAVRDRLVGPQR